MRKAESVDLFGRSRGSSALARILGAGCVAFFLSFNLVSSPWMDLGVGGLLLNFIACLFSVGFSHFF